MTLLPPHLTHLIVRWVHVLGMATLVGGAVLVWWTFRREGVQDAPTTGLRVAATYEWLFWTGAGLLVLTGVGNLGSMAPAIPGPNTPWGAAFATKLVGVVIVLLGSLVRTLGVAGLFAGDVPRPSPAVTRRLRIGYSATTIVLLAIVALAGVLAHG